ncbi:MAG: DUF4446 family protein [Fimbriimonadaceae bacterium]
MYDFARLLSESPEAQYLALALGLVIVAVFVMAWMLVAQRKRWGRLLSEANGASLEELLRRNLDEQSRLSEAVSGLSGRTQVLEGKVKSTIRYVGTVKYDAFGEVGGKQSFALALYNEDGHGAVLTSQVGREVCRVYCKELNSGQADLPLSREEGQAIEAAVDSKSRARVVL